MDERPFHVIAIMAVQDGVPLTPDAAYVLSQFLNLLIRKQQSLEVVGIDLRPRNGPGNCPKPVKTRRSPSVGLAAACPSMLMTITRRVAGAMRRRILSSLSRTTSAFDKDRSARLSAMPPSIRCKYRVRSGSI